MPFHVRNGIRYYTFSLLQGKVPHAAFTRQGGISSPPWDSLNLGGTVGDDPRHVHKNKQLAMQTFGRQIESLYEIWQVHGRQVVVATAPRPLNTPLAQADVLLTDRPEVTLLMRFADCVPILLHEPRQGVVGIAHAGWQGTVKGTALAAVEAMRTHFGSKPAEILAALGPSIGPDHYEVGEGVIMAIHQAFGKEASRLLYPFDGHVHLDLWAANRLWLERAGVGQIEVAELCTACHPEDWYSHRASQGHTGRFGVAIALPQ